MTQGFDWLKKVAELRELLRQQKRFRDGSPSWNVVNSKIDLVVSEIEAELATKQ